MGDCQFAIRSRALEDNSGRGTCLGLRELPEQVRLVGGVAVIDLDIIYIAG